MQEIHIQNLESRYIRDAVEYAQWEAESKSFGDTTYEGWKIPVWDESGNIICYRWKNAHRDAPKGTKARWHPKKPDTEGDIYYLLPDTLDAIKETDGLLFIASGEPDLMTFRQAGANCSTCWFGETAIPDSLITDLTRWGVERVYVYPDADDAGLTMAGKLVAMFRDSAITLNLMKLPDGIHDINDLWVSLQGDNDKFWATIKALSPLEVGIEYIPQKHLARQYTAKQTGGSWFQEWYGQIRASIDSLPVKREGRLDRFRCISPTHEDKHPSARISYDENPDLGIYVCSCGSHRWDEVGTWLGLGTYDQFVEGKKAQRRERQQARPMRPSQHQKSRSNDSERGNVTPTALGGDDDKSVRHDVFETTNDHLTTEPFVQSSLLDYGVLDERIPINSLLRSSDDAIELLQRRIKGKYISHDARAFPLRAFHHLGGVAQVCKTGHMIGVMGLSGFGKTSLLDLMVDNLMQTEQDVLVISPEITWYEQADRMSGRWGGATATDVMLHDLAQSEFTNPDISYSGLLGKHLDDDTIKRTLDVTSHIRDNWKGKAYYIDLYGADFRYIMAVADKAIRVLKSQGRKIRWVVLDYVQLFDSQRVRHDETGEIMQPLTYMQMLHIFRGMTFATGTVGLLSSQVTKADTRNTLAGSMKLSSASGQFIRDDFFKLFLSMNPVFLDTEGNERANYVEVLVNKNSNGQRGQVVELEMQWGKMRFVDHPAGGKRANYEADPPVSRDEFGAIYDDDDEPF
jgi:replicative DNA helicase